MALSKRPFSLSCMYKERYASNSCCFSGLFGGLSKLEGLLDFFRGFGFETFCRFRFAGILVAVVVFEASVAVMVGDRSISSFNVCSGTRFPGRGLFSGCCGCETAGILS